MKRVFIITAKADFRWEYMTRCDQCGEIIVFGGLKINDNKFCKRTCQVKYSAKIIPQKVVNEYRHKIRAGRCSVCKGPGPVNVYMHYRVWTIHHHWNCVSIPQISCKKCAIRSQIGSTFYSIVFGLWGIPGLVTVPIQVFKNIQGFTKKPLPWNSSEAEEQSRILLATFGTDSELWNN